MKPGARDRQREAVIASNKRRGVRVKRLADGRVFESLRAAAAAEGRTAPGIAYMARYTRKFALVEKEGDA